jgi:hypothetical protein
MLRNPDPCVMCFPLPRDWQRLLGCVIGLALVVGCGTTRDKLATEQMLLSDAVDRSVARIDFSPLAGEKVYLDTTYVQQIKGTAFVNADYIVSSIRQQMVLAGCLLQEKKEDAVYVAEMRVGVLGTDAHDVNYGVPGINNLSNAASLVSGGPPLPTLPEISFARKADDTAASKLAVFAYHRETREPVWQSGLSVARSRSQARWILGAGPFQSGSIYEGTQFAGRKLGVKPSPSSRTDNLSEQDLMYRDQHVFSDRLRNQQHEGASGEALAGPPESQAAPADTSPTQAPERLSERSPEPNPVQRADYTRDTPNAPVTAGPGG